jgi:polyhydroxyalkanoate synthesis repressor PhaR
MPNPEEPIVIKMHANQRLYNTGACTYVALEDLAGMVRQGEDFVVYDAGAGEDVTRSILMLITPTTEH